MNPDVSMAGQESASEARLAELDAMNVLNAKPLFLGSAVLQAGHGGIARVARMTAHCLLAAKCDLRMMSLLDALPVEIDGSSAATARGSKLRFAARCALEAMKRHQHFLYDAAGIARAHPRIPGFRRPYAVWMHGIEVWQGLRPQNKAALLEADALVVNSRHTLEKYRSLHGDLKTAHVCWLATEEDAPPERFPSFEGPPTALILGRIDSSEGYKGHAELVECWPRVVSAVPDARLLIAGSGAGFDALRSQVTASPVASLIELTGFVEEARIPALWQRAHVFAMPSRKEGFGIVYAEAMRFGVPVIASTHDAGQEINVHGETGFNVDLDRSGDLAEHLIEVLRSSDLKRRMGEAGRERWHRHFRLSAFRRRFLPIMAGFVRGRV